MIRKALIPFNKAAFGKPFGNAFGKAFGSHEDFHPADITNLVIWLDAGHGVSPASGPVDSWEDRSTKGNDATGTLTARPVFNPTGINGFPSLTFDGINDEMVRANTGSTGLNFTGSFTAYVVCKNTDTTAFRTMFAKSGNNFRFLFANAAGSVGGRGIVTQDTGDRGSTDVNDNSIMELHWDVKVGGLINITQNGIPLGPTLTSTISTIVRDTAAFIVGGGVATQFFKGEIGQVLIFDKFLSRLERNQMGEYLASRYHLTWTEIGHTPSDLPGLVLWLDAAVGVPAGDVSTWPDQSGNSNDATQTGSKRPVFNATGLNGFPAIEFDEVQDDNLQIDNSTSINLNNSFTYYTVINTTDLSSIRYLLSRNSPNGYEISINTDTPTPANKNRIDVSIRDTTLGIENVQSVGAISDNTNTILEVRYEIGGLVSFTANGVPLGEAQSNTRSDIFQSSAPLFVSTKDGTANPFDGFMAQVILYNRLLTLNERNFIGNYLASRYGLIWTDIKPFVPTDFAGLVLWDDAAEGRTPTGDSVLISAWADQSGEGNVAVQGDSNKQPFFLLHNAGLNNREALQFSPSHSLVIPEDSSLNFAGSFSIFVVTNLRFGAAFPEEVVITIFSKNGNAGYRLDVSNLNFPQIIASASTGGPQTITGSFVPSLTPLILEVNFEVGGANRVKMSQNGRDLGDFLNALANINTTSADFIIGEFGGQDFEGLIGQILVYNKLLAAPQRNAVGNYLADRYSPQTWTNVSSEVLPTDIPGIALWLDASVGASPFAGPISKWEDQSGQKDQSGNPFIAVQNTFANTPGFSTSALGGQGALVWQDNINQFMEMPVAQNSILDLKTDFTFYTVARVDGTFAARTLLSRNPADGYEFRVTTATKLETFVNDGGGAETDTSPNTVGGFQILEIHYEVGGTINFTANGVALGAAQANTLTQITSNAADLIIGAKAAGASPWFGEIAQFIIYNRLLTTDERNQVGTYLAKRYGFTWTIIT